MERLDAACEDSDYLFKKVKYNNCSVTLPNLQEPEASQEGTSKASFCILTKLRELHKRECDKSINSNRRGLISNSLLLEKLVSEERLNTLALILHPDNKGYTLSCRLRNRHDPYGNMCDDRETMIKTGSYLHEWPALSSYINNQMIPKYFVDLLTPNYNFLFYNGWIVTEIRDYRQMILDFKCDIHHVLLKNHYMGILSDVNQIMEGKNWGVDEKLQLESNLIAAYNPKLCLEPNTSLCSIQSRLNHTTQILNKPKLETKAHKYSQGSIICKRKLDERTRKPDRKLHDFVQQTKLVKEAAAAAVSGSLGPKIRKISDTVNVPSLETPIAPPSQISISNFQVKQTVDSMDFLPQVQEQHVLKCDIHPKGQDKQPRVYYTRLSILQRPSDLEYLGELYLDPNYKKEGQPNEVACHFPLGTKAHADRYLVQFMDIFTEGSGRKWVRTSPGNRATQSSQSQQSVYAQQMLLYPTAQLFPGHSAPGMAMSASNISSMGQATHSKPSSVPEVKALESELESSCQQFEAAANAHQQQKLTAININLLNSTSGVSDESVTSKNNSARVSMLTAQQKQTLNQKLIGRKMTISGIPGATRRVLNSGSLITINNSQVMAAQLGQQVPHGQTIGVTSAPTASFTGAYTSIPIKQQVVNQRVLAPSSNNESKSLPALLMGVASADRADVGSSNNSPLLLEKLPGIVSGSSPVNNPAPSPTGFIQSPKTPQYTVQSPKGVISPLSSPPPQNANAINVQSLNFTSLQNLSGLQNVQTQIPGFSQTVSLPINVSSTVTLQGHPTSIIVPVTMAVDSGMSQQATTNLVNAAACPTVVWANAASGNLAQLVTAGVKGLNHQNLRAANQTGVTIPQGQQIQVLTPLQRPRTQSAALASNMTGRGMQRTTPITIKMASPTNPTPAQVMLQPTNNAAAPVRFALQKQAQLQQPYQQLCISPNAGKIRRRSSNTSDSQ